MGKQRSTCEDAGRRAWRVLRLALLWARKGGLLKCRFMAELRHMPNYLKFGHHHHNKVIRYGERELSFEDTPVFDHVTRVNRHGSLRFMMPCIRPEVVDFDYDFGDDNGGDYEDVGYRGGNCDENVEDEGIDVKAEEFIAKFYQQMKMQKQISFQQRRQQQQQHTNIQAL